MKLSPWIVAVALAVCSCADEEPAATAPAETAERSDVRRLTPSSDAGNTDPDTADTSDAHVDSGADPSVVDSVDSAEPVDVADEPDAVIQPEVVEQDVADPDVFTEPEIPEATDDCEPLGIAENWAGEFDGFIESNIPDMPALGLYYSGAVNGEISFEIRCIDTKLMVFGDLDGGSTNCVLPNGCPFTARLEGTFNPDTQHIEGVFLDALIDYSIVQASAEGEFDGDLIDGTLTGNWIGASTDMYPDGFDWVTATGDGTWWTDPE